MASAHNVRNDCPRSPKYALHLPPLRDRREDILPLITYFVRRYAAFPIYFSQDAIELMTQYSWPGNVRELENVVRAAIAHCVDGRIHGVDILPRIHSGSRETEDDGYFNQNVIEQKDASQAATFLDIQVKEFKLKVVREALRQHRGNVSRTATALGMTRPTLYKLLKELNFE